MRKFIDLEAVKAAFRTAGALMMGNAFVGYFVLDKHDLLKLVEIGTIGLVLIVSASYKKGA